MNITIDESMSKCINEQQAILESFLQAFVSSQIKPGDRVEHAKAIFKTMALCHQIVHQEGGMVQRWWLEPKPEITRYEADQFL